MLATVKANGMPQLSPVTPYYDRAANVVSMTEGGAKTVNLRRDHAQRALPRGRNG